MPHRSTRTARTVLAGAVLAAALVACGNDTASDEQPSAAVSTASNGDVFNAADVTFATSMVPHHAEAIEMVTLAQGRPLDPAVAELAERIREAQSPEVEQMVDWLTAWDQEVPETSMDHANAHDHSGDGDTGTTGDMDALAAASDAEFQDLWLQMMVEHHTGAIEMAEAEQRDGTHADAVALAESIVASQQAEIEEMQGLLDS